MCDLKNGKIKITGEIIGKIRLAKGGYIVKNNLDREKDYKYLECSLSEKEDKRVGISVFHTKKKKLPEVEYTF